VGCIAGRKPPLLGAASSRSRQNNSKKKPKPKTKTAYYLKYRNLRPAYIDAVLGASATANTTGSDGLINWAVVSANYDKIAKATEAGGDGALLAAAGEIGQA
jgi:hypothetical protein